MFILLSVFLLQCTSDDTDSEIYKEEEFNSYVRSLSYVQQPEIIDPPQLVETISDNETADNYTCNVKRYKAALGFNELTLMDPTTDVIFPGAMIHGESVPSGEYIPIVADRAPINISVSLQNVTGSPYRTIENPSLSSVRAAIHDIFNEEVSGATPAQISFTMEEVHSEEQLDIALGASYKSPLTKMSGSFDFSDKSKRSRILVKFLQVYYTIDVDPKAEPQDFFNTPPEPELFGAVSPLYVSTVTYGRMALFTFESEYSAKEIKAAIDATFKSKLGNETGVEIDTEYKTRIESSKMNAIILGGAGSSGVKAIHGIEGLTEYIEEGGDYSKDSPGAPLSYKMRYLRDNSIAKIVLTSEYNVRNCGLNIWKILLSKINADEADVDDEDNVCELYGEVKYRINGEGPYYTLWEVLKGDAIQTDTIVQEYDKSVNLDTDALGENGFIQLNGFIKDRDPYESERYDLETTQIPFLEREVDTLLTLKRTDKTGPQEIYIDISIYRDVSE